MLAQPEVIHLLVERRFELRFEAGTGILDYTLEAGVMDIHHTYVPVELRGKNVAGQLAKAAFDFARAEELKVLPSCSYIAVYAQRNPEAGALI